MNKLERIRVAGMAAPILRDGKARRSARIHIVDSSGAMVGELGPLELAMRMLQRVRIELDVVGSGASDAYAQKIAAVRGVRKGSGNYADPRKIDEARALRERGLSLRAIASQTGLSKATVTAYVKQIGRAEAMAKFHAHRKAIGQPIVPPRRKSAGQP